MARGNWIVSLCLLVAVAYVARKAAVAFEFWFDGTNAWSTLFRPFPEWGSGAELYGALLPAKWIGTRTMWYAGGLLAVTFFVFLFRQYKLVSLYLFEGALIELLDVFWLATGKFGPGWSTAATDKAIFVGLLTAVIVSVCGAYLYRYDPEPMFRFADRAPVAP